MNNQVTKQRRCVRKRTAVTDRRYRRLRTGASARARRRRLSEPGRWFYAAGFRKTRPSRGAGRDPELPRMGTWGIAGRASSLTTTYRSGARGGNRCRVYRFVPPGTAWDRLGPDKFFSPRRKGGGKPVKRHVVPSRRHTTYSGACGASGRVGQWVCGPCRNMPVQGRREVRVARRGGMPRGVWAGICRNISVRRGCGSSGPQSAAFASRVRDIHAKERKWLIIHRKWQECAL